MAHPVKPMLMSVINGLMCFTESGGRKINENKMLTSKKAR